MNFRSAVLSLRDGQAIRTGTMRGYIGCQELEKEEGTTYTRKINMYFKENIDGNNDGQLTYSFEVEVYPDRVRVISAPDPALMIDSQLMELLLSEDWFTGSADEFEIFRSSPTKRW
jgi:hypothetical protein